MNAPAASSRLFVALPVPDSVRQEFTQAQAELRSLLPPRAASWTRRENFHLTLRFLGNVATEASETLQSALADATRALPVLNLNAGRLGCFPNLLRPRVIWAGVHDDAKRLQELHQSIRAATAPFAPEPTPAEFTGHITLARISHVRRRETALIADFLERCVGRRFGGWRAEKVLLMKSELGAGSRQYSVLAEFPLGSDTAVD